MNSGYNLDFPLYLYRTPFVLNRASSGAMDLRFSTTLKVCAHIETTMPYLNFSDA